MILSDNAQNIAIPKHRLAYINLSIENFISMFDIKKWPLDCVTLLKEMQDSAKIPVQIGFVKDVSDEFDAVSRYVQDSGVYQIIFNRAKIHYPFCKSSDRRLNFTIAHEIGHIILEHLLLPDELKTNYERNVENLEADEFAGRLLMPKKLVLSCNYYSINAVAAFMNVSKAALKTRLENLNRVNLLKSRKVPSCTRCGNTHFSAFVKHCSICGQSIKGGLKGMQRIYYSEEIPMDRYKRVFVCPSCNQDLSHINGEKCKSCGTYIFNFCSGFLNDDGGDCDYSNSGNARYCEMCGRPTDYFMKGIIKSWEYHLLFQNKVGVK